MKIFVDLFVINLVQVQLISIIVPMAGNGYLGSHIEIKAS